MKAHPAPNHGDGAGRWLSTASPSQSSSLRADQHQMKADAARGKARGDMRRLTCVAGNDPQHDRSGNRAGFIGFPNPRLCGAMSRASHCRSAAGISPHSRRPVLETLPGIGLNSPAERIRAARGAFNSVHGFGANRSIAHSVTHKPLHNLALREIQHLTAALSNSVFVRCINKCQQARTNNCHSVTRGVE